MDGAAPCMPSAAALLVLWWVLASPSMVACVGRGGARAAKTHLVPRFYDFHHCTDKQHSLIVKNFTFLLDKQGAQYCDVDFDLTAPSAKLMGLRLKIHRCTLGSTGAGECEYYNTWEWKMPVCNLLYAEHMVWTPLVHNLKPTYKCPIQSGAYEGRNTTLDFESLEKMINGMNLEKFAWPVEVMVDGEQSLYICFKFVAELRRLRIRDH